MPSILFATPMYGGNCTWAYFNSCLRLQRSLIEVGLDHDWLTQINESLVHRARNQMTATFLQTDHTHMMWWDADIEGEVEDVSKLWNLEVDIACGVYAMKKKDEQWYAAWKDGALVRDLDQYDGPIEVDYAGTGFLLIKREVIEALAKTSESYEGMDGQKIPALYMTPITNGVLESEDYYFCRKAREAGFKVIMDPSVRLKHWGQYPYGR